MADPTISLIGVQDAKEPFPIKRMACIRKYWIWKNKLQYEVYKGYVMETMPVNGQLVEQKIGCSILDTSDVATAQYQLYLSHVLGKMLVRVLFVDGSLVGLDEIKLDFKDWYSSIYNNYVEKSNDYWWKHIEADLKKLFRGIVKSLIKLFPNYSHNNWMKGIAVFDGEGKLYNMKYTGNKGYLRDIENLYLMFEKVLMRSPPTKFDDMGDSDDKWSTQGRNLVRFNECLFSKECATFMSNLKNFIERKNNEVIFYTPYFWSHEERDYFMKEVYYIFWLEIWVYEILKYSNVKEELDACFPLDWSWWTLVPSNGPFRKVFEYSDGNQEEVVSHAQHRKVDSIAFWHDCRSYYNDYLDEPESPKSLKAIETEVDEKFSICNNVFIAICTFINEFAEGKLLQRLIALREEIGFSPFNINASTASTSTPNSNATDN